MPPFFSVIIPCYNRKAFLPALFRSFQQQTFTAFEVILVDDGSTDGTEDFVKTWNVPFLVYLRQPNAERSAARNKGISAALGQYILFLDSDDALEPQALQALYTAIAGQAFPVAVFGTKRIYYKNGIGFTHEQFELHTDRTAKDIIARFGTVPVDQCAHRNCFAQNRFDPRFTLWEDTHLWLRILRQYPCIGVPEAQIRVTVHDGSTVAQGLNEVRLKDVHRYRDAVLDLLNYSELFPSQEFDALLKQYVLAKYQMYIYQARTNRQYETVILLLKESTAYGSPFFYRSKTLLKIRMAQIFGIHLS